MRSILMPLLAATTLALISACAGPEPKHQFEGSPDALEVDVNIRANDVALPSALKSVKLWVSPTIDGRSRPGSRVIGLVKATVSDIHSTELHLAKGVDELTNATVKSQLLRDGYQVVQRDQVYEYELGSLVREFALNVAGRDEISLQMDIVLKKKGSENVAWQARISESSDRFAGVMGNSRATLSTYLENGLSMWARQSSIQLRTGLELVMPPTAPLTAASITDNHGWIAITTSPERAKVYIDHIYFGQTPLRARLPAGVVALEIRRDGYQSFKEMVSVRSGETTQLESTLDSK